MGVGVLGTLQFVPTPVHANRTSAVSASFWPMFLSVPTRFAGRVPVNWLGAFVKIVLPFDRTLSLRKPIDICRPPEPKVLMFWIVSKCWLVGSILTWFVPVLLRTGAVKSIVVSPLRNPDCGIMK